MGRPRKTPAVSSQEPVVENLLVEPSEAPSHLEETLLKLEKRIQELEKLLPKKPQAVCVEIPSAS